MMHPEELTAAAKQLGLTHAAMARALSVPERTFRGWIAGRSRIPGHVRLAVARLLEINCAAARDEGK